MSTTTQSTNSDTAQRKVAQQVADILAAPLTVAQRLLPTSPLPLALGTGALLVGGVVDLPLAAAIGLGYLALRNWRAPR